MEGVGEAIKSFIIICFVSLITVITCNSIKHKKEINKIKQDTIVVYKIDSTKINHLETEIELLKHKLQLTQDSLSIAKDSIGEDLFIARYKLERIRYYNEIAGKGNNIKYLRGWLNRVLNE